MQEDNQQPPVPQQPPVVPPPTEQPQPISQQPVPQPGVIDAYQQVQAAQPTIQTPQPLDQPAVQPPVPTPVEQPTQPVPDFQPLTAQPSYDPSQLQPGSTQQSFQPTTQQPDQQPFQPMAQPLDQSAIQTPTPTMPQDPAPIAAGESTQTDTKAGDDKSSRRTWLIVIIAIAAALLVVAVLTIVVLMSGGKNEKPAPISNQASAEDERDAQARAANQITARFLDDLSGVCRVGSIVNVADFELPYKVAAFYQTAGDSSWSNVQLKYQAAYTVEPNDYEKVNVVACIKELPGERSKEQTCDYRSGDQIATIDYLATSYSIDVHEAKSGKKIKSLGTIKAAATTCPPPSASFNRANPRIIAAPSQESVNTIIAEFAKRD